MSSDAQKPSWATVIEGSERSLGGGESVGSCLGDVRTNLSQVVPTASHQQACSAQTLLPTLYHFDLLMLLKSVFKGLEFVYKTKRRH